MFIKKKIKNVLLIISTNSIVFMIISKILLKKSIKRQQ